MGAESDESDEEDLWAGLDDYDSTIACSANLMEMLGRDPKEAIVHKGDADENKITWVPPAFAGLTNSTVVTCKTQHWNRDSDDTLRSAAATPEGSMQIPSIPATPMTSAIALTVPATGVALPSDGNMKGNTPAGMAMAPEVAAAPLSVPAPTVALGGVANTAVGQPAAATTPVTSMFSFSADGRIQW